MKVEKFFLVITSVLVFFTLTAQAEEEPVFSGVRPQAEAEYLKLEQNKMLRSFADTDETLFSNLPRSVNLASQLPSARNQGRQNSCTGFAVSFAVKSFQEARELGWTLTDEHLFSPAFVYNQINGGKDEGADLVDVMDFVQTHGTVPLSLMPYLPTDYLTQPSESAKQIALGFRSLGYRRVAEDDLKQLKAHLAAGEPVILVIKMFESFLAKDMRRSANVYQEKSGKDLGFHALVAVGYDDDKQAVKILNSWGSRWGEEGYAWISYDFYPQVVERAYLMYDTPTAKETVLALSGQGSTTNRQFLAQTTNPAKPRSARLTAGMALKPALLIVPDEAGVTLEDQWLRLGVATKELKHFFKNISFLSEDIQAGEGFMKNKTVSELRFYGSDQVEVSTNQGVSFGEARPDVLRIYGQPDLVEPGSLNEFYFYHAVVEEWGGIPISRQAALIFHYDDKQTVDFMALESVFKQAKLGTSTQAAKKPELKQDDLAFTAPPQFSDIQFSDWGATGYGYFLRDPNREQDLIVIKVFSTALEATRELLDKRITADRATLLPPVSPEQALEMGGTRWLIVSSQGGKQKNFYTAQDQKIIQIQLLSDQDPTTRNWYKDFLASLKVL